MSAKDKIAERGKPKKDKSLEQKQISFLLRKKKEYAEIGYGELIDTPRSTYKITKEKTHGVKIRTRITGNYNRIRPGKRRPEGFTTTRW